MTEEAKYYKPCSVCHNTECVWVGTKDTHLICEDYKSLGGDCISRQAVLDGLASIAKAKAKSDAQKALMGRAMFFVMQMPSAKPKTGHWINEDVNGCEYYRCSECRSSPWDSKTKCCPDCGARMEGVNE